MLVDSTNKFVKVIRKFEKKINKKTTIWLCISHYTSSCNHRNNKTLERTLFYGWKTPKVSSYDMLLCKASKEQQTQLSQILQSDTSKLLCFCFLFFQNLTFSGSNFTKNCPPPSQAQVNRSGALMVCLKNVAQQRFTYDLHIIYIMNRHQSSPTLILTLRGQIQVAQLLRLLGHPVL